MASSKTRSTGRPKILSGQFLQSETPVEHLPQASIQTCPDVHITSRVIIGPHGGTGPIQTLGAQFLAERRNYMPVSTQVFISNPF